MNGEGSGGWPTCRPPSNEYCIASDAAITNRPLPGELLLDAGRVDADPARHARREGSGETAVEEEGDLLRPAPVHQPVDPGSVDASRQQSVNLGVGRGQVQLAVVILQSMAREVHKEKVIPGTIREERLKRADGAHRPWN